MKPINSNKSIKKYSLIVFDWDGTLVDSVPNIVEALSLASQDLGLPVLNDEQYKGIIGLSLGPALLKLYPDLAEAELELLKEGYKNHHRNLEQTPSVFFQSVEKGLEALSQKGVLMAVATGKSQTGLKRSMLANNAVAFFHDVRTADDARSKPDPEMIEQLLQKHGVAAHEALMVGDSGFDMEMAARIGVDRVAVTYGAQEKGMLERFDPVMIADNFNEFLDWLTVEIPMERDCVEA